jgi:CheY-like chemotaxis protein
MIGVLGMADLLRLADIPDRERELADTVYRSGEALLDILNGILDFSKIEAGKLELEELSFNLRETVENALDLLAEIACSKGLELVFLMSPLVPEQVVGDPGRIRQIIINLVGNALKFTDRGEIAVTITASPGGADDMQEFEVAVRDTGVGLAPDACEKIFDAFAQADNSMTRQYGGTGLGLAVVRELAGLMGGSVSVESRLGEGSCFRVALSLPTQQEAVCLAEQFTNLGQLGSVLVAIPHSLCREQVTEFLSGCGFDVKLASSEWMQTGLLLPADSEMDYRFCLIDGDQSQTVEALLEEHFSPGGTLSSTLPIVLSLPEHYRGSDTPAPLTLSGQQQLSKPLSTSRLAEMLRGLIAGSRSPLPAASVGHKPETTPKVQQYSAHVLIAEDNPTTQQLLGILLQSAGLQVSFVRTGREAIDFLERVSVDLVFMDCQMPEMDGLDATRMLRSQGTVTPIVALTAYARQEDEGRCFDAGMNDFLSKPFRQKDLWDVLGKWLGPSDEGQTSIEQVYVQSSND